MLATIYINRTFGVSKIECTLIEASRTKYAQYNNAIKLIYKPKGKRKAVGEYLTYKPHCIIIEGHNHPEPNSGFITISENDQIKVSKSIYSSFDERYKTDFDKAIEGYLQGVNVLHDFRNANTF